MSINQVEAAYQKAAPYTAFLYIWGLQWALSAGLRFFAQWRDLDPLQPVVMWTALAASAVLLFRTFRHYGGTSLALSGAGITLCAAVVLVVSGLYALARWKGIDPLVWPLLKGILLTLAYAWFSRWLGRPLLYLSLWMLALTVTVAWSYLGFAQIALGVFGGLSMMALAWMIGMWNRGTR
ncbi:MULTISPECIES: hypothetical protein [Paenibacillus]|uniref:hypothetical protein n=1 Tax=Paenibacillus TaxID=44249 RepID=UPI001575BBEB|nr:hypothetical protein [Paenibacillus sp. JMULE4]NTZ20336.1 hypothetical protein [Paenibacillus sp. JMULE4]